jgi:hypothetical protein
MDKEQIYDEKINHLMAEIISVCKEHKISMVASFAIPSNDDPDLFCSTSVPDETDSFPAHLNEMFRAIQRSRGGGPMTMLTMEHDDGTKTMTAI